MSEPLQNDLVTISLSIFEIDISGNVLVPVLFFGFATELEIIFLN